MGWLFPYSTPTKASIVEHILREKGREENVVLSHRVVGDHLWIAGRIGPKAMYSEYVGKKIIVLYLLSTDGKGWGYKVFDETNEPHHYDCPISFLDLAKDFADDPRSAKWREGVRAFHAEKKAVAAIELVPGTEVVLNAGACALEGPYRTKGYWIVRRLTDGARYKARVKDLKEIIAAAQKAAKAAIQASEPTQEGLFA
jgi:hypothetical protein